MKNGRIVKKGGHLGVDIPAERIREETQSVEVVLLCNEMAV